MMKICLILVIAWFITPCNAEPKTHDIEFPSVTLEELLQMAVAYEGKSVVVPDESTFNIETSLILPDAEPKKVIKVIHALLVLNGYVLVEVGEELHLRQLLTKEQCTAFNQGLGREGEWPRRDEKLRLVRGRAEDDKRPRVIVRPAEGEK